MSAKKGNLTGIFTDGDLRRQIESDEGLVRRPVKDVMTKRPVTVSKECLASEASRILKEKKIDELPVVDKAGRPLGMLDVQDFLRVGLM